MNRSPIRQLFKKFVALASVLLLLSVSGLGTVDPCFGQVNHNFNNGFQFNNVGGVAIDAKGVVADLRQEVHEAVGKARLKTAVPKGIEDGLELRKFSLRGLQEAVMQVRLKDGPRTLPEEIRFLGGIQRIQYVFVYPDDNDIVLAGPGEAWRFDDMGNAVGTTSGQPVLHLQDFLVALRSAFEGERNTISCSIDPTQEGVQRMRTFLRSLTTKGAIRSPRQVTARKQEIEDALGLQNVTVRGIAGESRFAWTLVAADYRMKQFAMGLDEAPVKGMPSFVKLMGTRPVQNMMPRWWMEDNYEALLTDAEGLAWELRGQGVQVRSEDELVADDGTRRGTGRVSPIAKRWADTMTENFEELVAAEPVFGHLRNCMDLAVVSALIQSENLHRKAGMELALLLNANTLETHSMPAPQHAPSQVSFLVKGSHLAITASGGVQINPWKVASKREKTDKLTSVRDDAIAPAGAEWWWD